MPSDAITEKQEERPGLRMLGPEELTPSVVVEDEPSLARWIGFLGLALVLVATVAFFSRLVLKRDVLVGFGAATICLVVGLAALLFHAAFDRDVQFRRVYFITGAFALVVGVFLSLLPHPTSSGDLFGPGFGFMILSLLFLLAPLRHETDTATHHLVQMVLGGAGAVMAAVGLLGGSIQYKFLVPYGLLLALLGLVYLAAYIVSRGTADDRAYQVGRRLGWAGAAIFILAALRSIYPPLTIWWRGAGAGQPASYFSEGGGLLLMVVGLLYLLVSLALCSDRPIVVLTRRELGAFFYSPIAYFVLFIFVVAAGINFLSFMADVLAYQDNQSGMPEPIVRGYMANLFPLFSLLIAVPVATMRLLSEEQRSGTMEVLLTVPVEETTVVLSKFLAAWIMFLLSFIPYGLLLIALRLMGGQGFDTQPLLAFFLALAVTGAGFVAMGLFCSALTRNQVASAVLCFGGMVALIFIVILKGILFPTRADQMKPGAIAITHVSFWETWVTFLGGRVIPSLLLFHASVAIVFLFLTVKWLEARKWR